MNSKLKVAGIATATFLVGIGIGSAASGGSATAAAPAPVPTVSTTVPGPTVTVPGPTKTVEVPGPTKTVTVPAAPAPAPAPAAPAAVFSDGQYEVGTDVAPGKYRTASPAEDNGSVIGCYMDIQDASGNFLAQEITSKGNTIVTIKSSWKGAIITSRKCGDWVKVG